MASPASPLRLWIVLLVLASTVLSTCLCIWFYRQIQQLEKYPLPGAEQVQIDFLPLPASSISFDEVRSDATQTAFIPLAPDANNALPDNREGCWFRLRFSNPSDSIQDAVIDFNLIYTDEAIFYMPQNDGSYTVHYSGEEYSWSERARFSSEIAFDVQLPPLSTTTAWLFARDYYLLPQQFLFWPQRSDYDKLEVLQVIKTSAFLGLWLALVGYNIFLYAVLRRTDNLYYILYAICIGFVVMTSSNSISMLMPWFASPTREGINVVMIFLSLWTLSMFTRSFLETPQFAPRIDLWIRRSRWLILLALALIPLIFANAGLARVYLITLLFLCTSFIAIMIAAGVVRWRNGAAQAPMFVVAIIPFFIGFLYSTISHRSILLDNDLRALPLFVGHGLELIFFALVVAQRHRIVLDENAQMHAQYMVRLEKDVADRTTELSETSRKLAQAIEEKNRIFAIIGHDLREPTANLKTLASTLINDAESIDPKELSSLAKHVESASTAQIELLENLIYWGRSQSGQWQAHPENVKVSAVIEKTLNLLQPNAAAKNVVLQHEAHHDIITFVDQNVFATLVRNLISNAIKFTHSSGYVYVSSTESDHYVEICIQDTGIGIEPERLNSIFSGYVESTPGTHSERGTGIGLNLCRDLARSSGGDLTISSSSGKGTTARITLPRGK